jgi:broad specificity phosphatase PhoE
MKPLQDVFAFFTGIEETRTFTVYLIRHGEACHNILEKKATEHALAQSLQQGLNPVETESSIEKARQAVRNDPSLFDAPLSVQGKKEARKASAYIVNLVRERKFPALDLVLVSPLQRALQTAALAFPGHSDIHVREELRERQTGYACDSRQPSESLMNRKSFQHFSMHRLRMESFGKLSLPTTMFEHRAMDEESTEDADDDGNQDNEDEEGDGCSFNQASSLAKLSSRSEGMGVEEKNMLRERTKFLFPLLLEAPKKNSSIVVVTHKGYLRELERGQFGIENSPLYDNGEVRVYEVKISKRTKKLIRAKRLDC